MIKPSLNPIYPINDFTYTLPTSALVSNSNFTRSTSDLSSKMIDPDPIGRA